MDDAYSLLTFLPPTWDLYAGDIMKNFSFVKKIQFSYPDRALSKHWLGYLWKIPAVLNQINRFADTTLSILGYRYNSYVLYLM